jgi:hypothetical protein
VLSKSQFSGGEFLLNVLVELFKSNGVSIESSNGVDDFPELVLIESILKLVVDILKFINTEFSSSLQVVKAEISSSSLLGEW